MHFVYFCTRYLSFLFNQSNCIKFPKIRYKKYKPLYQKEIMDIFWMKKQPCAISDNFKTDSSLNRNTVARTAASLEKKDILKQTVYGAPLRKLDVPYLQLLQKRHSPSPDTKSFQYFLAL